MTRAWGLFMERGPGVQIQQRGTRSAVCSASAGQSGREGESHTGSKYLKSSGSRSWLVSTLTLGNGEAGRQTVVIVATGDWLIYCLGTSNTVAPVFEKPVGFR